MPHFFMSIALYRRWEGGEEEEEEEEEEEGRSWDTGATWTRAHICERSGKHRYFVRTLHLASCVRPVILELLAEIPLAKRSPNGQQSAPNAARLPEILRNQ